MRLRILAVGSRVKLRREEFSSVAAQVVSVSIQAGGVVRYEVVWWSEDGDRCTDWVETFELDADGAETWDVEQDDHQHR